MPFLTVELLTRLFRIEAIANPGFGEKVAWRGRIRFDLLSKLTDEDPQEFGLPGVISAPDRAANRKHDDWNIGDFSKAPAQLETAHVRHRQVSYHQRGWPIAKSLQRKFAIAGDPHIVAFGRQTATQHARKLRLVVNHQNALFR